MVGIAKDCVVDLILDSLVPSLDIKLCIYLCIVEGGKEENKCNNSDFQHRLGSNIDEVEGKSRIVDHQKVVPCKCLVLNSI